VSFQNEPSVLDGLQRTHMKAFALNEEDGRLRVKLEAVPENPFFEASFIKVWAFEFEDEFFGASAEQPMDTQLGLLASSTDTKRLTDFREQCRVGFPEHLVDLREYRLRTTSEILSVVCQGRCSVIEIAP
jgi:hypothetical protein